MAEICDWRIGLRVANEQSGISVSVLDYVAFGWVVASFIALYRFRINMITWIGVSAVFGLVQYLVTH